MRSSSELPPEASYVIPLPHEITIDRRYSARVRGVRFLALGDDAAGAAAELETALPADNAGLLIVVGLVTTNGHSYEASEPKTTAPLNEAYARCPAELRRWKRREQGTLPQSERGDEAFQLLSPAALLIRTRQRRHRGPSVFTMPSRRPNAQCLISCNFADIHLVRELS